MTGNTISLLVLTPRGALRDVTTPGDDVGDILHALYHEIGCKYVDVVRLGPIDMWLDDEALLQHESPRYNPWATYIAARHDVTGQRYFETVVFSGPADRDGHTTSMTPELRKIVTDLLGELDDYEDATL